MWEKHIQMSSEEHSKHSKEQIEGLAQEEA